MKVRTSCCALMGVSFHLWTCFFGSCSVKAFSQQRHQRITTASRKSSPPLFVSIGLGPESKKQEEDSDVWVEGVDYEIPDHESFRKSRRSKLDEQCDAWFEALLGSPEDDNTRGCFEDLAVEARRRLMTPVELKNEFKLPIDDPEWTPYVSTKLPWTPLTPAFGLEEFGLPIPRRNAETWRHFDVVGMVEQDYSGSPEGIGTELQLSDEQVALYQKCLKEKGGWLDDDACQGRLVYINGRFVPQLSMTSEICNNLQQTDSALSDPVRTCLSRLTDGFTDELAAPVPVGENRDKYFLTSFKRLSAPDHCLGDPTSQFAINTQQGTACFAALNTIRTGAVAYIHTLPVENTNDDDAVDVNNGEVEVEAPKPVLVVNAITNNGGLAASSAAKGVACHPRTLVMVEKGSQISLIQASVDLDTDEQHVPKLYNGYTQVFLQAGANLTHSYLDETGGMVTPGVELSEEEEGSTETTDALTPRVIESQRPQLKDTHLEAVDVHICGEKGGYKGTLMSLGGSGRIRIAMSVSLLRPGAEAAVNGFALSGGAQRTDIKTNIHHIASGTKSRQVQKSMIGGRAVGAFRGRVRVEQSAQQTDSEQLSRSILLSDRCRAWTVPSLEIIADDVKCTHGATVSDLSEEELFYLRSRGLSRNMARNLLMYAFAGDITRCVDQAMLGEVDSYAGLQRRVIRRLENVVPQGNRAVAGEYQSV